MIITITKKRITNIVNNEVKHLGDGFLKHNTGLRSIEMLKLKTVGHYFLNRNKGLTTLSLPNLAKAGHYFLVSNKNIKRGDYIR